jgi:hypothetical protein
MVRATLTRTNHANHLWIEQLSKIPTADIDQSNDRTTTR